MPEGNPAGYLPQNQQAAMQAMPQQASAPAPTQPNTQQPSDAQAQIDAALGQLDDTTKQLLAEYLTPEFAQLMGSLLGPEVGKFFEGIANPEMILVPMNRQEFMNSMGGQSQTGETAMAEPIEQSPGAEQDTSGTPTVPINL